MMLEIAIEADEEWDSSTAWERLVRDAAEAAIAESAFPHARRPRTGQSNFRSAWPAMRRSAR